ncbi:MAG: hypothetical protein ACLTW9_06660 [Enterocloster sp.]
MMLKNAMDVIMGSVILENILMPRQLGQPLHTGLGHLLKGGQNSTMEEPNCHISSIQMVITAISGSAI